MSTPAIDLLSSRAFPELADAVCAVVGPTVLAWERAVREALPPVNSLTRDQLRNDLPIVLKQAAEALQSTERYPAEVLADITPEHGSVRFEQGYKIEEVLKEYTILRTALVQELTAHLRRNLEAGEILALGAALDITARRVVVRFVADLTRQIQAASEAQSKYLSFLSHDLRGGLNGVFLMIEVLKRELAGEARLAETVSDLDTMRRSLLETVSTMDRFLHAERFRKGKVQVRPGNVTLRNAILETVTHFSYQAKEKRVEIRVNVPAEVVILSDKELLAMIFQNLLSNALKYTNPGTAVVIDGKCDASICRISVIDQGPGIAPEKLSELFDAFSRGETHGQPGVGLGLSIARQAAQYLGAKLWAESKLGSGSAFIVELPREMKKA